MKLNYFNFKKLGDQILMTNDFGEFIFVSEIDFRNVINANIDMDSEIGKKLLDRHMIYDETNLSFSNINRYRIREIKNHLNMSTSLHIFVVTTACNVGCVYCQANNGTRCSGLFMDKETARRAVDIALESPTKSLTFEFQGGEPLLNFEIIKYIVEYSKEANKTHSINYTVVSNLTLLTDEMITYFKENNFGVSTSLDGHEFLHNKNRPYKDGGHTYRDVIKSIGRLREAGIYVGAIQTTTKESLKYPR